MNLSLRLLSVAALSGKVSADWASSHLIQASELDLHCIYIGGFCGNIFKCHFQRNKLAVQLFN